MNRGLEKPTAEAALGSYIFRGGSEGRARLAVIAQILAPTTARLLHRMGPLSGATAVDVGCGGGDVSFEIAGRVGPKGKVVGLDLDEEKLALARSEAEAGGVTQARFEKADVLESWPVADAQLVYARFILTHVRDPALLLRRAMEALAPGGRIALEDIDYAGYFSEPDCPALERYKQLFITALRKNGGDPFIGRRLAGLLDAAGFEQTDASMVQPFARHGEVKTVPSLTFKTMAGTLIGQGLIGPGEADEIAAELDAFIARPDTTLSWPRIFQAWGRKPGG